jgi:glutathione-regulated potassium-efflux system ancillary protein KefG
MKKWIDSITTPLVYGDKKGALKGKGLLISTTTGGPEESYSPHGYNKYSMKQFLLPLLKLGDSLGKNVLEPLVMHSATGEPTAVHTRAQEHTVKMINEINYQYETVLER